MASDTSPKRPFISLQIEPLPNAETALLLGILKKTTKICVWLAFLLLEILI
jgi:hypothetical protein